MPALQHPDVPLITSRKKTSSLKPHRDLPKKSPIAQPVRPVSSTQHHKTPTLDAKSGHTHEVTDENLRLQNSLALKESNFKFPPTPPTPSKSSSQEASSSFDATLNGGSDTLVDYEQSSTPSTPVNQCSPLTPEITPPRMFSKHVLLEPPKPRFYASSQTESFETALESPWQSDIDGNVEEEDTSSSTNSNDDIPWQSAIWGTQNDFGYDLSPGPRNEELTPTGSTILPHLPSLKGNDLEASRKDEYVESSERQTTWPPKIQEHSTHSQTSPSTAGATTDHSTRQSRPLLDSSPPSVVGTGVHADAKQSKHLNRALEADRLALDERVNKWRMSEASTVSNGTTIEALVVAKPTPRNKRLRHVAKASTLRTVSTAADSSVSLDLESGLEAETCEHRVGVTKHVLHEKPKPQTHSSRPSRGSHSSKKENRRVVKSSEGPDVNDVSPSLHRKTRVLDIKRYSTSSSISEPPSLNSSQPEPLSIVPVVVIPERRSSLKSSSSNQQFHSTYSAQQESRPATAPDSGVRCFDLSHRPRRFSASLDSGKFAPSNNVRVRDNELDAPAQNTASLETTNQDDSRVTPFSLTMLPSNMQFLSGTFPRNAAPPTSQQNVHDDVEDEEHQEDWTRFSSAEGSTTPFSRFSRVSSSPSPVQISQATAVSIFPHQNRSLLVVHQRSGRSRAIPPPVGSEITPCGSAPATPPSKCKPFDGVNSPLRNPRTPPKPPRVKVIPPTPAAISPTDEANLQLGADNKSWTAGPMSLFRRISSKVRPEFSRGSPGTGGRGSGRPTMELYSEDKLHPFWKPARNLDNYESTDDSDEWDEGFDGPADNSSGPAKRSAFSGPRSLVKAISMRKRTTERNVLRKVHSHTSVGADNSETPRASSPPKGTFKLPVPKLQDMQKKLERRKEKKHELRREIVRQRIRESIGTRIVHQDGRL